MKIKIVKEEKIYNGTVINKVVTPFGNSGHLNIGKKYVGRIMKVIDLKNPQYKWILPTEDLQKVMKECKIILNKQDGKMKYHKERTVEKLKDIFEIEDLYKVLEILKKDSKKNKELIKKIKKTYAMK